MKKLLWILALGAFCASCLKDGNFKNQYYGFTPVANNDETLISTPIAENMDPAPLEKAYRLLYQDDRFYMAKSLLVYRNGKLVAEAYPNDDNDINRIENIQSCTKSITSILVGIARDEGLIDSLNQKLYSVYPEHFDSDQRKRDISFRHALTMQTGLEFNNSEHTLGLYESSENTSKYVLKQDFVYQPGVLSNYNDGAPQLLANAIEKLSGQKLDQYAEQKLFNPLNIKDWKWEKANDGSAFGAFSLYLKPRDFAKIGQMLINNGSYMGSNILSNSYIDEATKTWVALNYNFEPYGYYFWIMPAYKGYAALGHGGQFMFVSPSANLVVVYTAWPYTSGDFFDQRNELISLIYNSCK